MKLLRAIRTLRHYDRIIKHLLLEHKGIEFCFINSAICVAENPGISQDKLAGILYVNKSTMTRNLSYFEENGYVTRKQSSTDKRISLVYPTEKMNKMLSLIDNRLKDWEDSLFEGFTKEEEQLYMKMTNKMLENATNFVDKTKVEMFGENHSAK